MFCHRTYTALTYRSTESVELFFSSVLGHKQTLTSTRWQKIQSAFRIGGGEGGVREQAALAEGEEEESNIPVYGGSGPGMK